jgi:hypothetical protein
MQARAPATCLHAQSQCPFSAVPLCAGLGPTRVREQARIRCLHFDCGPRGLVRASDICASTLTLLSRVACARCGADVRLTDDGITLCTRCAPAPEEASGALFRWRWAPAEVLLECREGILVSASLADAAVASLFGFSAQLLHEEEEEEDKEAARAETIGVGGFGGTVAGRVPRVGTVGRAVLDMCSGLESRLHEGVEEQELWVDMDFDESLDTSGEQRACVCPLICFWHVPAMLCPNQCCRDTHACLLMLLFELLFVSCHPFFKTGFGKRLTRFAVYSLIWPVSA